MNNDLAASGVDLNDNQNVKVMDGQPKSINVEIKEATFSESNSMNVPDANHSAQYSLINTMSKFQGSFDARESEAPPFIKQNIVEVKYDKKVPVINLKINEEGK